MRAHIIKVLLWILNSRFLNGSPCQYGFIGNLDAFSYENLASEEKQCPGVTVKAVLENADRFKSCSIATHEAGVTVIDYDGSTRSANAWDMRDLEELSKEPGIR